MTAINMFLDSLNQQGFEPSQIKIDDSSLDSWGKDWTKHFAPTPSAIVFPKNTEQVIAIVRLANEHGICLVPSGGRTGLSAGAVASAGEVVVSFDKMNSIGMFYEADRMVEVEGGLSPKPYKNLPRAKTCIMPWILLLVGQVKLGVTSVPMQEGSRLFAMA